MIELSRGLSVYELLQHAGKAFLLDQGPDHERFVRRAEIIRSFLHLSLGLEEKGVKASLKDFLAFVSRLEEYGEDIPLAAFGAEAGIRVRTMHRSKGLEFDAVWIAHMNERALMSGSHLGFALPERIKELLEEKDEAAARREVYVAVTRAKRFCALSYARASHRGSEERLAAVIEGLPGEIFLRRSAAESERLLLDGGPERFVRSARAEAPSVTRSELAKFVRESYEKKKVSVTLLNNFFECPWKWYFRSFLEVPEPLSESLEFGSVVHGAIEFLVKLNRKPSKQDIDAAILEGIMKCHIVDELKMKRMMREAEAAVKRFTDLLLPNLYERRESEKSLGHKDPASPQLSIYGKLDLIEMHDGDGVRVTDFKTGKTKKASEIEKIDDEGRMSTYMRQLAMYSYLVRHAFKGASEVEASRLYFVEEADPKKACYETCIDDEKIDLLMQDIKDYDALMKSGEWTERECNYKAHQGEPDCPYCKKAEMYK
jgi:DNA helicase-2/ATP-dependent DNA helicase PcrA